VIFRLLFLGFTLLAGAVNAQDRLRFASFNVGLGRDGPGALLKDIQSKDKDILALAAIIAEISPDVMLLTNFDTDYRNLAVQAFIELVRLETSEEYLYFFAPEGNSGFPSGLDLNSDSWLGDWADNWGFGLYPGFESMVLLSKFPINLSKSQTFPDYLWRDLPNASQPKNPDGSNFFSVEVWRNYRLASKNFWDVVITLPDSAEIRVLASHATPPVFDGSENRNGLRNDAEVSFWGDYINQSVPQSTYFVILADFNADPKDGEGLGFAINALRNHPRVNDPAPISMGALQASINQGGINLRQSGNPATDTADWADSEIGNLRVDYVLPSSNLTILQSGVFWPEPEDALFPLLEASQTAHRLVWVDVSLP